MTNEISKESNQLYNDVEELHRYCVKFKSLFGEILKFCVDSMRKMGIKEFVDLL